jgi:hypothetical protein
MLSLSALPTASALASHCTVERGESLGLCVENQLQKEGTFAFTGQQKAGTSTRSFDIPAINVSSECGGSVKLSKGSLIAKSGKLEVTGLNLEYEKCKYTGSGITECELASPSILVDGENGTGSGPGLASTLSSATALTLKSGAASGKWTEYTVRSTEGKNCSESYYDMPIKGEAKCQLPESTVEAVSHVLKCEEAGDSLSWSGKEVQFELTAEVKLASGKQWSI